MTDDSRRVEVEIDVPGTPEQVWQAIATGPGYTAWFVPTKIEEREGGQVVMDHGPGLGEDHGTVTHWDPPRHFGSRNAEYGIGHEIFVEAREGGMCRVRLVNSGFGADWDDQLDSVRRGWRTYLLALRLYLEHFPGERATPFMAIVSTASDRHSAWSALTEALGLGGAGVGDPFSASGEGAPPLSGTVEHAEDTELMLRLEEPADGHAFLGASSFSVGENDQTFIALRACLFGPEGAAAASREEAAWRDWLEARAA